MNGLTVASEKVTPRSPRRSRTIGLVAFLFATAGLDELPGLARMRRDGQLRTVRHGREVGYRLAGPFAAVFERLRAPTPSSVWEGHFHALLHQVPEAHRAYRDRLRRIATFVGYGVMQPGVLVAVRDLSATIAPLLAEAPPGCRLHHARLAMGPAEAAEIAIGAWGLDDLASRMREHVAALSAALALDEAPAPSAAGLRRFVELRNAPLVDLIDDPNLPVELLPSGWPGPELAAVMAQVQTTYGPPAEAHVHAVLSDP